MFLTLSLGSVCGGELRVETAGFPHVEGFNTFTGTWCSLPQGWYVSKDGTNAMDSGDDDFRGVDDGGVTAGGCYAWQVEPANVASNHALGYQPTSDEFTPGHFGVVVSNATGGDIRSITVCYDVVCLNNADRSSGLDLDLSVDGTNYVRLGAFTYATPALHDANAWTTVGRSGKILLPRPCGPGKLLWLRWVGDDAGGSGSRDEYGIDNVGIACHRPEGTVIAIQ
jgi:hypothetical protein